MKLSYPFAWTELLRDGKSGAEREPEEAKLDEEQRKKLVGLAQALAMTALDHPPKQRQDLLRRAVEKFLQDFEQKHGSNPANARLADKLLGMATAMVETLEESGGQTGNA